MKQKHKKTIFFLVLVFSVIVVAVGFNIYHNLVTSVTLEALKKEILPINPNFDENAINSLKKRKRVVPIYETEIPLVSIENFSISKESSPSVETSEENSFEVSSPEGTILP